MSSEDEKMLEYLKALGVPPMKNIEGLKRFMTEYGATKMPDPHADPSKDPGLGTKVKAHLQAPRISIFFGEDGKGEVSYQTCAYEVKCLKAEGTYTDELLLQAIRRSLRGHAADQLRYIGVKPTIDSILDNFNSTYGMVETPESILKKFYACKQNVDESVLKYCIRLEDIHAQAIEMKALTEVDGMLKRVFYRGLVAQLKHLAAFKFEIIPDYRSFKRKVRQIENELNEDKTKGATEEVKTKCHSVNKKEEKTDTSKLEQQFGEVTSMLEKLNTRMEQLEKKQEQNAFCNQQVYSAQGTSQQSQPMYQHTQTQYNQPQQMHNANPYNMHYGQTQQAEGYSYPPQQPYSYKPVGWRGQKHFRGPRSSRPRGQGPFRGQGRGDSTYRVERPLAGNTFQPECYACHKRGHLARECPLNK